MEDAEICVLRIAVICTHQMLRLQGSKMKGACNTRYAFDEYALNLDIKNVNERDDHLGIDINGT
jgi:hypothetical protein